MLAQEYIDHGGVVLKGYTVGELRHVATRPSLPNLRAAAASAAASSLPAIIHVDSQAPVGSALGSALSGVAMPGAPATAAVAADDGALGRRQEAEDVLAAVRAHLGLELLGVDMVVAPDGALLVVDVNHFSGAPATVPGFEAALAQAVARAAAR